MKKIIHIDMDSFFASVEVRDNPELLNKPIAVGGLAEQRGVIATSNYVARKYGVYSAMSTAKALLICPDLIVIKPRMDKYKEVSNKINNIFHEFTDKIEPISIDEAFLDVSDCEKCNGSATLIASEIKKLIYKKEKLTASAGVSVNKFLAKVASDWNKPNGLFVIKPDQIDTFIKNLPVTKIPGVGKVTAKKLADLGFFNCSELQKCNENELKKLFGRFGSKLYNFARGVDFREVETTRTRKSLSVEETFIKDLNIEACLEILPNLINELNHRLMKVEHNPIYKLFVKIKFFDFEYATVEKTHHEIDLKIFRDLVLSGYRRSRASPIRLLGIGVRFLAREKEQLSLLF